MGIQPTASKTELLSHCIRPFSPDTVIDLESDIKSDRAIYGTAFHLALHNKIFRNIGYPTPDSDLNRHVESAYSILLNWIMGDNPFAEQFDIVNGEISLAYNPNTSKCRITELDLTTHTYNLKGREIGGTYDLLLKGEKSGIYCVIDYKTGDYGNFTTPETYPQLLTLALMTSSMRVGILHTPKDLPPIIYSSDLTSKSLSTHKRLLRTQLKRVGDGSITPGKWCKYCIAKSDCIVNDTSLLRSTTSLVRKVTESPPLTHSKTVDLGSLHMMLSELDRLAKRARDEIRDRVRAGEVIQRPDGKTLEIISKSYERLSKSSILEACGKLKGEELLSNLRALGCLSIEEREEMRAK